MSLPSARSPAVSGSQHARRQTPGSNNRSRGRSPARGRRPRVARLALGWLLSVRLSHTVAGDGVGTPAAPGAIVASNHRDGRSLSVDGVYRRGGGAAARADAVACVAGVGVGNPEVCLVLGAIAKGNGVASGHVEEAVGPGDWADCDGVENIRTPGWVRWANVGFAALNPDADGELC